MKKMMLLFVSFLLIFCSGCGENQELSDSSKNSSYYKDVFLDDIKTYEHITGNELISSTEGVDDMIYTYQVNNKDDYDIDKYGNYLVDDCGFSYNRDSSSDEKEVYDYKGNKIFFYIVTEKEGTFLKIYIPVKDIDKNVKMNYDKLMSFVENSDYSSAKSLLSKIQKSKNKEKYADTKQLNNYLNGELYLQARNYGEAIDSFRKADNYRNSNDEINKALDYVKDYDGAYYYDNPKLPNLGQGYYIFIKDGMVSMQYENLLKSGESVYYSESLARKYNDENKLDELFIVGSLAGLNGTMEKGDYRYLVYEVQPGKLLVSSRTESLSKNYFPSAVYIKVDKELPSNKSI